MTYESQLTLILLHPHQNKNITGIFFFPSSFIILPYSRKSSYGAIWATLSARRLLPWQIYVPDNNRCDNYDT
jgi:hypothetical protein